MHSTVHKTRDILLLSIAALFVMLIFAPRKTYASSYRQQTYYDISVTKTWDADTEPEAVDITMSYSGNIPVFCSPDSGSPDFPDSIPIYYKNVECGTADKLAPNTEWPYVQEYEFTVEIPFHFSSYDSNSKSQTISFDTDQISFSVNDIILTHDNSYDYIKYAIDISWFMDLDAMADSTFSESADSGKTYDFSVIHDKYDQEVGIGGGYYKTVHTLEFTVTNTKKIDIPVTKTWIGDAGESADVHLWANDEKIADATLTADNNWTYTFEDLSQKDSDGNEITYTLTEDPIEGYDSSITGDADSGFTVTNTKKIDIPVTKIWVGDTDESATVHLLANGDEVASHVLNKDNDWSYTFTDLAQADSSGKITYTVTENDIDGYTYSVTGDAESGFTVTNVKISDGALVLTATKTVNNKTPGQSYTFCLLDSDGNILQTKQNDSNGKISFDPIQYETSDIGTEFIYQIIEKAGSGKNITYDSSVYTVTVTPERDPENTDTIIAVPTITKDGKEVSVITFNNTVTEQSTETETTEESTESKKPGESTKSETTTAAQETTSSESAVTEKTPNTGDSAMPVFWTAAAATAAAGIFVELRRRMQNQK